ncbi:hypothetical protein SAMN05216167_10737 [Spirosoma endophyticum]|uniref:Endonuclease/exonuclease/phosphatase domain-containing protein n=1 Tax=Spirosoma endophyticum TaxID=662367 RepID=A0A1I1V4G7_9BACT|nr:hypothetical protein SAMN05216167_10737 [Spirosoma endophyticum]
MKQAYSIWQTVHKPQKHLKIIYTFLALAIVSLTTDAAYAQLITNTFQTTAVCSPTYSQPGNSFTSTSPNVTATPFTRNNVSCSNTANVFSSTGLNLTSSPDDTKYIEFSIKANSGYALNLTSLSFFRQGSNTAPNSLLVSYSTDNFVTRVNSTTSSTPSSGTALSWTFTSPITTIDGGTVTFRFYPYGSTAINGSASASTGTFRVDDVTLFGSVAPTADIAPTVTSTTPANSATYIAATSNISLTFSEPVTAPSSAFTITGSTSGPHTFALTGGPTSYTLNPDTDFTDSETVTVTALAAQIADQDGTTDNMASDFSFSFTIAPPVVTVKIHDIQGTGLAFNPTYNTTLAIEGIVTRKFLGSAKLNGFYVQEEDADADANPLTSEAIFVFDPAGLFTGNEGDKVKVTGTVLEFVSTSGANTSSLTELASLLSVVNQGPGTLPTPTVVNLPINNVSDLEAYEGMLVTMGAATGNLAVTEYFQLGQYGQIVVSATGATNVVGTDARLDQYTQYNAPSVSGYPAYLAELAKRKIILDDGSSVSYPDPVPFGRGGQPLSATNTLRGGDEIASITTVLDERFEGYRLQLNTGVNFLPTNVRPTSPPAVGGTLKVASANVLNYFNGNGTGQEGSAGGFPTSRGATNLNEFTRQRTKVLQNLFTSGADVIGLMEVENDGYGSASAIQDLVNGLNTLAGTTSYTFVNPGVSIASDVITVGMIYKPGVVSPVGSATSLVSSTFTAVGRQPLAQTFQEIATGGIVTVVVNHFKSKGSGNAGAGDADINDGQGAFNGTRTRQAQELAAWLATKPTKTNDPDYLILGDLNSYAMEDPITSLASNGYGNLLPTTTYSYVFDGQVGALDHALGTGSLATQVTGAEKWHINADEPSILDYNTENKSVAQQANLYSADPFRSSDHDPVLIGLNLAPSPDLTAIMFASPSVQYGTSSFNVVVDVFELSPVPTSGPVSVYVTKDPLVSLSFNPTSDLINGKTVQNSDWTFNNTDPNFYILTTNVVIAGKGKKSFGLTGMLAPGSTKGSLSLSTTVVGGNGGEVKINNNSDADVIDYFDK